MRNIFIVLICLLVCGCVAPAGSPNNSIDDSSPSDLTNSPSSTTSHIKPPDNMMWISPGKVIVGNFHPGARAEWILTLHNGNDKVTNFSVEYRYPDHVDDGYSKAPAIVQDWVIIADPIPVLEARETREILIVLEMPSDAEIHTDKWEFWISVQDETQTGMVITELCSRWLVCMR